MTAAGLALVFEGLPYLLLPGKMKEMASRMSSFPSKVLQGIGLAGMAIGLLLIYLGRLTG